MPAPDLGANMAEEADASRRYEAEVLARANAERAADRLARLESIGERISRAVTAAELATVVAEQTSEVFGARSAAVYAVDGPSSLRLIGSFAFPAERFATIPLDREFPLADAVVRQTPVYVESFAQYETDYPASAARVRDVPGATRAFVCFPLANSNGEIIAGVVFSFDDQRAFAADERRFLDILARQTALGLERAWLYEQERDARSRLAMLQAAGDLLASSLDYETTLHNVVRAAMPTLGDFGFIDVVEENDVRRIVHAHDDEDTANVLRATRWARSERRDLNVCALSSGESGFHPDVDDAWMQNIAVAPEHLELLRRLAFRSMITVPLASSGRTLGALTLFFGRSERRHTEADLRLAEELARRAAVALDNARLLRQREEAIRMRDDFLSIASHELNTPLTSVRLNLHALRKRELDADTAERIEITERQVVRLSRLVSELLDVSRMAAGKMSIEPESVDLGELIGDTVTRLSAEILRSRSEVRVSVERRITGSWDRLRLEQVVNNLLVNALKYGDAKPIEIRVARTDEHAVIEVRDRGIGIAPDDRPRIFDRFERAVSAKHFGGLGLGLWIARQIVEAHGGTIEVASVVNEGSTFAVKLPL